MSKLEKLRCSAMPCSRQCETHQAAYQNHTSDNCRNYWGKHWLWALLIWLRVHAWSWRELAMVSPRERLPPAPVDGIRDSSISQKQDSQPRWWVFTIFFICYVVTGWYMHNSVCMLPFVISVACHCLRLLFCLGFVCFVTAGNSIKKTSLPS